jgi:hypothetical protein
MKPAVVTHGSAPQLLRRPHGKEAVGTTFAPTASRRRRCSMARIELGDDDTSRSSTRWRMSEVHPFTTVREHLARLVAGSAKKDRSTDWRWFEKSNRCSATSRARIRLDVPREGLSDRLASDHTKEGHHCDRRPCRSAGDAEQHEHADGGAEPHGRDDTGAQAETPLPHIFALMTLVKECFAVGTRGHVAAVVMKTRGQNLGRSSSRLPR